MSFQIAREQNLFGYFFRLQTIDDNNFQNQKRRQTAKKIRNIQNENGLKIQYQCLALGFLTLQETKFQRLGDFFKQSSDFSTVLIYLNSMPPLKMPLVKCFLISENV